MNMEIKGKKIPAKFLKQSPHERRFPEDNKFPLEEAEDERNAVIDDEDRHKFEAAQRAKEDEAYRKERAANAKAEKEALKATKAAQKIVDGGGPASGLLHATDMDGNILQPIPSQDAFNTTEETAGLDEDDIMGAIARMEGRIAEYKSDSGAGADVDTKETKMEAGENKGGDNDDHADDQASLVSKLSFAEEQDMSTPLASVENTPRDNAVIQTPLHLSRKELAPKEERERERESKGVSLNDDKKNVWDEEENLKTQEAVHSSLAGGEAEAKAGKDSRDAKEDK